MNRWQLWWIDLVRLFAMAHVVAESKPNTHAGMSFCGEPREWFAHLPADEPIVMIVQSWRDDPTYVGHATHTECPIDWQPHLETECGFLRPPK